MCHRLQLESVDIVDEYISRAEADVMVSGWYACDVECGELALVVTVCAFLLAAHLRCRNLACQGPVLAVVRIIHVEVASLARRGVISPRYVHAELLALSYVEQWGDELVVLVL